MKRRPLARWAQLLLPCGLALAGGCGQRPAQDPARTEPRPLACRAVGQAIRASHDAEPSDAPGLAFPAPAIGPREVEPAAPATVAAEEQALPATPSSTDLWHTLQAAPEAAASSEPPTLASELPARVETSPAAAPVQAGEAASLPEEVPVHVRGGEVAVVAAPADSGVSLRVTGSADSELVEQTELPWAKIRGPSPDSALVLGRAGEMVREAEGLAARGAVFAARNRLLGALRLLAQSADSQQMTQHYTRSLSQGLVALGESRDFAAPRHAPETALDVAAVVAGHRTPILKNSAAELSPAAALARYYTYAQEQLGSAGAAEAVGSLALYQMGKVTLAMAAQRKEDPLAASAQAVTWIQAALLCDQHNHRAAHDLGVLMARYGRWEASRNLLTSAATQGGLSASWRSLELVCQRLGDKAAAAQAHERWQAAQRKEPGKAATLGVLLVDPATLAQTQSPTDGLNMKMAAEPRAGRPAAAPNQPRPDSKSFLQRR